MSFNLKNVKKIMGNERRIKNQYSSSNNLLFIKPADLDNGEYKIRLLPPDPQKNPEGFVLTTTHSLELHPEASAKSEFFYCPTMYDQTAECPLCELVDTVTDPELEGSFKSILGATLSPVLSAAPIDTVKLYILISADTYEDSSKGTKKTRLKPSENMISAIITLGITSTLWKAIYSLVSENPHINDANTGHYLILAKAGLKYSIQPQLKPSELEDLESWAGKNYPNLIKMGKEKLSRSKEQIEALIEKAWWYPQVEEALTEVVPF